MGAASGFIKMANKDGGSRNTCLVPRWSVVTLFVIIVALGLSRSVMTAVFMCVGIAEEALISVDIL